MRARMRRPGPAPGRTQFDPTDSKDVADPGPRLNVEAGARVAEKAIYFNVNHAHSGARTADKTVMIRLSGRLAGTKVRGMPIYKKTKSTIAAVQTEGVAGRGRFSRGRIHGIGMDRLRQGVGGCPR